MAVGQMIQAATQTFIHAAAVNFIGKATVKWCLLPKERCCK